MYWHAIRGTLLGGQRLSVQVCILLVAKEGAGLAWMHGCRGAPPTQQQVEQKKQMMAARLKEPNLSARYPTTILPNKLLALRIVNR